MEERGWSDPELADNLGIKDRGTIGRWRKGKPILSPSIGPLVRALETNRAWLVSGIGDPTSAPAPEGVGQLRQELLKTRSTLLDGLAELSQASEEQKTSLVDLLRRVGRLERGQASSRS